MKFTTKKELNFDSISGFSVQKYCNKTDSYGFSKINFYGEVYYRDIMCAIRTQKSTNESLVIKKGNGQIGVNRLKAEQLLIDAELAITNYVATEKVKEDIFDTLLSSNIHKNCYLGSDC